MDTRAQVSDFKFRFVVGGQARGFLRSPRGRVGDAHLELAGSQIRYDQIGETVTRGNRLLIQVLGSVEGEASKHVDDSILVLEPKGVPALTLESLIDRHVAQALFEERRRAARESGVEHLLRVGTCPTCGASIDLTDFKPGRYTYCQFCDSIFEGDLRTLGRTYRTCDECGFFGRVQQYPEFYFYFLLIVYGFSYKQRFLCGSCANRLFIKALFLNLIFVVGVPTALWVKLKSMLGLDPDMAPLRVATDMARKGKLHDAAPIFASIRQRHPDHPGVLMNEALARLQHGDRAGGQELLSRALDACPNYFPLMRLFASE